MKMINTTTDKFCDEKQSTEQNVPKNYVYTYSRIFYTSKL